MCSSDLFVVRGKMSVSKRHFQVGMSHQLADRIQIDTFHNELACEVVSHIVPSEILYPGIAKDGKPCFLYIVQHFSADGRRKNKRVGGDFLRLPTPSLKSGNDFGVHRQVMVFAGLGGSGTQSQSFCVEIDVSPSEREQVALSHAGIQRYQDHGLEVIRKLSTH